MLAFRGASGRHSFSLDEALKWCETHHPEIHKNRFTTFLREAAANRKRPTRGAPVADLLWQLTPNLFINYDPATDPVPGSTQAAAWVVQLALQERDDVERADILRPYCAHLVAAIDALKASDEKLQAKAEGLAGRTDTFKPHGGIFFQKSQSSVPHATLRQPIRKVSITM